jgi:WD40 repeat protein
VVQRFRTEAAAAASLQHPNIVAIHEVGEHEGQLYYSMDYIAGRTLAELVRDQALPAKRAATHLKTIAQAVHYAHQHGILHRDLKPSNILMDSADQPRITDFGLAKRLDDSQLSTLNSQLTVTGQVLGSPNFMSPEQAGGRSAVIGPASDIYSLGALLYHLLTRQPPFQADTLTTLLKQVTETEPIPPRLLNPSIPRDLETICLKCLEKEPPRRYSTAKDLAADLGRFLEDKPIQARPVGAAGKAWKWCRRRPALAGMGAALALTLVLGLAAVLWQWQRARDNELLWRKTAYADDMRLAQLALDDDKVEAALGYLNKHRPTSKSTPDLRHWEWRYLWQLCQPDMSFSLRRDSARISLAVLSQDGGLLAIRTGGPKVTLWDLTTRRPVAELPGLGWPKAITVSPRGVVLTTRRSGESKPLTVEFWDVQAGKLIVIGTLSAPSSVLSLAVSPDGKSLATLNDQGTVEVRKRESGSSITNLTAPPLRRGGTGVVLFSPDGNRLAVGADYGWLQVVSLRSGAVRKIETQTIDGVSALAFSPDSQVLAAGFGFTSGTVRLWDSDSGEPQGQLTNATSYVHALAFTPDGRRLAAGSADGTIRIWNVADGAEIGRLRGHPGEGLALAFQADGRTLVSACPQRAACVWDLTATNRTPAHTSLAISSGYPPNVSGLNFVPGALDLKVVMRLGLAFTPDSRSFITTDPDGTLGLWDTRTMKKRESLPALGSNCWNVALSPDGHWLAVGDAAGKVHIWDWPPGRRVASLDLDIPFEWFGHLRFSRSGRFLLATVVFNNRSMASRIWRTDQWEEVPLAAVKAPGVWGRMDLSPDDRLLALRSSSSAVTLLDFASGRPEVTFTNLASSVSAVQFSPDGRRLASTSTGQAKVWDVFARCELATLLGHSGSLWDAAFSPDGQRLATGGDSPKEAVKLWDLATQRELLTFPARGSFFMHVTFSPDGNTLTATSLDGVAHLWRAPTWAEIEAAERRQQAQ